MKPIVSIIIPVYNAQRYLRETLDSVLQQTFQNYEVIAVNDGSMDESLMILNEYADRDSRIRVIDKANSGVSDTRNTGIAQAQGTYLCFLDADDLLLADYLSVMVNIAQETDAQMVVCDYVPFHNTQHCFPKEEPDDFHPVYDARELLDSGRMTSMCTKLVSAKLIHKYQIIFNPDMSFGEDLFFCWKAFTVSNKVFLCERKLYGYRMGGGGATGRFHPNVYERYREALEDLKVFSERNGCLTNESRLSMDIYFAKRIVPFLMMTARERTSILKKRKRIGEILQDETIKSVFKDHWDMLVQGETKKMVDLYRSAREGRIGRLLRYGYKMEIRSRLSRLKTKIVG